jgi:chromate transporter
MSEPAPSDQRPVPGSDFELFITFVKIALSGFGGVLAWTYRALVEDKRWLDAREFNELLALSQFLPGPNIVNFSVVFGARLRGVTGAIAALAGVLGPPLVLVVLMAMLYAIYGDLAQVRAALHGISAAAAGVIIATVTKLARPLFSNFDFAPFIAIACFVGIGVMRWPLLYVLPAIACLSCGIAYVMARPR